MTPSARLEAAIQILDALASTNQAADRYLRDWFRARRYAGAKDRAAIGERVYSVLRHRASLGWRMGDERPRALVIASLLSEGLDEAGVAAFFDGTGYGPAPLGESERAAIVQTPGEPPLWVRGEFPAFLEPELLRRFDGGLLAEMRALNGRAPVDLRVNRLKATRDDVVRELRELGLDADATPYAPDGIRLVAGQKAAQLRSTRAFLDGRFEFQDEAAQIACVLCGAEPGQHILDSAAGAGGKALALAAAMNNAGAIVARDNDAARLSQLAPRAARAGATIIREQLADRDLPARAFDTVFVDAPCSGSGAWRRQPEQKWRLAPARLDELLHVQDRLLDEAAAASGARIVYATCSVLPCENEDRIEAFLSRHPEFRVLPAREIWSARTTAPLPPVTDRFFNATPLVTGTDGFFAAVFTRAG